MFEISVWHFYPRKVIRDIAYFGNFEMSLFLIKQGCEQTVVFDY